MTIETNVRTIADLDAQLPAKGDYISEGDDHIKLIKHSLQSTFPNADAPLTSAFQDLSKVTEYMEFTEKTNTAGTTKEVHFKEPTLITNLLTGTADGDVASVKVVNDLIEQVLLNKIYRVGNYYYSDDSTHPRIALGLPTTDWVRVYGFVAGKGTDRNSYTYDDIGGNSKVILAPSNMPQQSVNGSNFAVSSYTHDHSMETNPIGISINNNGHGDSEVHRSNATNNLRTKVSSDVHNHTITGSASIGNANPTPVDITPTYTGTFVWKRTK